MKHGEAPSFLMWCGPLLFTFGMAWVGLVRFAAVKAVAILDTPIHSALLVGAGVLGTVLGQLGMLWAWRRYVRTMDDNVRPVLHSTVRSENATDDEPSYEVATKRPEVRR